VSGKPTMALEVDLVLEIGKFVRIYKAMSVRGN